MIKNAKAVCDVFTPIAPTYRRANRALTLGLDGYWRRQAVRTALRAEPATALDVCTGTGETAACLHRMARGRIAVTGLDFNEAMLHEARIRQSGDAIAFRQGDATALPFPDASFDLVTISFALRNLNVAADRFSACLRECQRVLRPGGRLVTVETTQSPYRLVRWIVRRYVGIVVPWLGTRLSGSRPAYAYLANTIPRFHGAPRLAAILNEADFAPVTFNYLTFGLVAIHDAIKTKPGKTTHEGDKP